MIEQTRDVIYRAAKSSSGYTLIELLIVAAIISLLAGIAIPILLRSRMSASETSAIGGLKVIADGQTDYFNAAGPHSFSGNLQNLANGNGAGGVGFIDVGLGSGNKAGYTYLLIPGPLRANNTILTWRATCWPQTYASSGVRSFYIDQSGIIRGSDNGGMPGDPLMPALD